jgi:hypothetical protein
MTGPQFAARVAIAFGLLSASPLFAADGVSWVSVQRLFPGPKPEKGALSPADVACFKSQTAQQDRLTEIGHGDEKAWKYQGAPATIVVLQLPLAVGCKYGPPGFVVGVLDAAGKLIARSTELFSAGTDADMQPKAYRIDTAPYKISNAETVFGVRIAHYRMEKHWCYTDQVLHLFRVVGKDVVRVLGTDTFYEQVDQIELAKQDSEEAINEIINDPDCSFSEKVFPPKGQAAVFRMLPTQTQGFYDIQSTQKGRAPLTYRWNGQRYVMDGKDAVDHHVREEWDGCTGRRFLADHGLPAPPPGKPDKPEAKAPAASGSSPSKH